MCDVTRNIFSCVAMCILCRHAHSLLALVIFLFFLFGSFSIGSVNARHSQGLSAYEAVIAITYKWVESI